MNRRNLYIVIALVATVSATWWAASLDDEEGADAGVKTGSKTKVGSTQTNADKTKPQATPQAKRTSKTAVDTQSAFLKQLIRAEQPRVQPPKLARDPFAPVSFQPPPPPPPKMEQVKPVAPPLRFQYQGLLRDGDNYAVFLVDGADFLIAREGETLAGQYRVEKVTEREMVVEYLPLNERQTLNFGRP